MYIQVSPVEIQNPTEVNQPQHDCPTTCVITPQYSSTTFISAFKLP
jgi:hypothetical protein